MSVLTEFYQERRPELNVRGNDSLLRDAANKPLTIESLNSAADRLQDSLALTPAAKSAWEEYRFLNPDKSGLAFRIQFFEQWRAEELKSEQDSLVQQFPHLIGRPIKVLREAAAKQELLEDIARLLEGVRTSFDLKIEIKSLSYQSLEQLQARKQEILTRQRLHKLPTDQIKAEIAASRPHDERPYPGYPNLPDTIVPQGQVQAVRCDSAYLLNLARIDFYEYKRLCARFSSAQITDRQQHKS